MKNKEKLLATFLTCSCLFTSIIVNGQTTPAPAAATPSAAAVAPAPEAPSPFKVTADLVTSYYWRGTLASATPNFQPTFSFTTGPLEIGVWGSTDFISKYKELDIYASLTTGPLKFTVTDYDFYFNGSNGFIPYFNYSNSAANPSGHIFEGSIGYSGPASFPISVTVNTMFAGNDYKGNKADSISPVTGFRQDISKQAYSTYIEFDYTFKYFSPFLGITPSQGYYGDGYNGKGGFGVCNLGITASKNLKITDTYSLPLKATLGFNPQKEDAYCVFGITF
jgi:hypothetical protein